MPDRQCILVVDDHDDIRLTLADILEDRGYSTDTAADGQEAINRVKRRPYCMVIMDVRMPRKDGPQAFKEIRELCPELPVVMVSAYPVGSWAHEVAEYGPLAMLTKPLDLERLLTLVDQNCRLASGT